MKVYFCFLFIIIILLIINSSQLYETFQDDNKTIELVIARYNEDLEWTTKEPFNKYKYTVYNKGENENFNKTNVNEIISVDNVGRCDHTYLYHIINNYNDLADIVVFLPGSLDMSNKIDTAERLINNITNLNKAVFLGTYSDDVKEEFYDFKLDEWQASYGLNADINNETKLLKSPTRPFGKWFQKNFGDIKVNYHCYFGIFSIDRRDIIQNPIPYYQFLIKDLETHSNPEAGHYFERSWAAVFHPLTYTIIEPN
jgi:hypothetical protein